jgi:hypothetical protein
MFRPPGDVLFSRSLKKRSASTVAGESIVTLFVT